MQVGLKSCPRNEWPCNAEIMNANHLCSTWLAPGSPASTGPSSCTMCPLAILSPTCTCGRSSFSSAAKLRALRRRMLPPYSAWERLNTSPAPREGLPGSIAVCRESGRQLKCSWMRVAGQERQGRRRADQQLPAEAAIMMTNQQQHSRVHQWHSSIVHCTAGAAPGRAAHAPTCARLQSAPPPRRPPQAGPGPPAGAAAGTWSAPACHTGRRPIRRHTGRRQSDRQEGSSISLASSRSRDADRIKRDPPTRPQPAHPPWLHR